MCAKHAETLSDELKPSATVSTIFEDAVVLPAQPDIESAQVDEGPTGALDLKPSSIRVTKATSIKKKKRPAKSWVPLSEAESRKRRASDKLTELGLDEDVRDRTRRRCGACFKYLSAMHLGRAHESISRGKYFCPFIDDPKILEIAKLKTERLNNERFKRQNDGRAARKRSKNDS